MRYVGPISEWNDEKGYGFVVPNGGGERAFVHIKAFERRGRRPLDGDLVSYVPTPDDRRRLNATGIRFVSRQVQPVAAGRPWFPRRWLGLLALIALAAAAYFGQLPLQVTIVYLGMSLIAFFAYGLDKSAARTNRWRTKETTLQLLALLGGWPGALIAQGQFRHKTRKAEFQITFWLVVAGNLGVLAWLVGSGRMDRIGEYFMRL